MTLLNSVTDATMTTGSLDAYGHQKLARLLCDVMATCSHESVVKRYKFLSDLNFTNSVFLQIVLEFYAEFQGLNFHKN